MKLGHLVGLGVRIACLIAIWQRWGWLAAMISLAAVTLITIPKGPFGSVDLGSPRAWVRIAVELAILIGGVYAANLVWGQVWAATLVICYIIGFVTI